MLSEAYDDWAARSAPDLPFLVVDTDEIEEIHEHPAIVRLLATLENDSGAAPRGDARRPEPPGARS